MATTDPHATFASHIISRRDDRTLLLQNPGAWCSNMWCTIAIDDHGQIVVFGDFGPMVFGISRGPLEDRIAWIGSHPEADSYICEKANIGMSAFRRAMTVATAEDFEADVRQAFTFRLEEDEHGAKTIAALTWDAFSEHLSYEALESIEHTPMLAQRELDRYLVELGLEDNWEWIGDLGERPIPEIGLAHAALRRAHLLLGSTQ